MWGTDPTATTGREWLAYPSLSLTHYIERPGAIAWRSRQKQPPVGLHVHDIRSGRPRLQPWAPDTRGTTQWCNREIARAGNSWADPVEQTAARPSAARVEQYCNNNNEPIPKAVGRVLGRVAADAITDLDRKESPRPIQQYVQRADELLRQFRTITSTITTA